MHFDKSAARQEMIQQLVAEHNALEARVNELEQHLALSPQEQVEIVRLKKLRLRTKDQLYTLQTG